MFLEQIEEGLIPILLQTVDIDESDYEKIEKYGRCPLRQKYQSEQAEDLEDRKEDDTFDANDRGKKSLDMKSAYDKKLPLTVLHSLLDKRALSAADPFAILCPPKNQSKC